MTQGPAGTVVVPPARSGVGALDQFLSIVVLFDLAIAWPLLELLGRNPEFFLAHDLAGGELVLGAVVLTVLIPGVVAALVILAAREWTAAVWVHHVLFALLCAALFVQVLKRVPGVRSGSGALLVAVAFASGALAVLWFRRSPLFRSFVRTGTFVPFLVIGLFVFGSRASGVISPAAAAPPTNVTAQDPVPVVVIVMDELPLASIVDRTGHIDDRLFPSFARIASEFTWFRNATTVHNLTAQAVPALLDGRYPRRGTLPTLREHPINLFTLLGDQYEMHAVEQVTDLCPATLCDDVGAARSRRSRWSAIVDDLEIVVAHVVLPRDLAASLPRVDEGWADFGAPETVEEAVAEPVADLEAFEESLTRGRRPQLYFLHLMLPHPPWRFLPSGARYPETAPPLAGFSVRANGTKVWDDERWPVIQAYQRHLLQVALVDRLIGDLIDRLRHVGLFDDAMIVLTSDHGAVFRPGLSKRSVAPETVGEVGVIPLFVKRPGQTEGTVSDEPAQTIDVVPTIQDELRSDATAFDGRSLFGASPPAGLMRQLSSSRTTIAVEDPTDQVMAAAAVKYRLFDLDRGIEGLFDLAPPSTEHLIGSPTAAARGRRSFDGRASIAGMDLYEDVDPAGEVVPVMIAGTVSSAMDLIAPVQLAVGVNGRVWAVTQTFAADGPTAHFYALVPPRAFVAGHNDIELFAVDAARSLAPITIER